MCPFGARAEGSVATCPEDSSHVRSRATKGQDQPHKHFVSLCLCHIHECFTGLRSDVAKPNLKGQKVCYSHSKTKVKRWDQH